MRNAIDASLRAIGSLWLSTMLLVLLGLLTWLGTLEQVGTGLYEVQKKYFESFFLIHQAGPIPVPLPGANLVLCVLFVNLVVGGMIRLRKSWSMAGILVTHVGIAVLLLSGVVKLYLSDDGHMTLYESERSNWFQSYYRTELAVSRELADGRIEEFLVPQEDYRDAVGPRSVRFRSDELPFDVEVSYYMQNSRPLPKGPEFEAATPVVDGAFLQQRPLLKQAEANSPGMYAAVVERDGTQHQGILWSRASEPWTVTVGGERWLVDMRKERYLLPFTVVLQDFEKEDHPRMTMPKSFSSDVTVVEGPSERPVTISMNEPLRDRGFVLYQASWGPSNARPGDPLFSTLSVVRNPADQYPLYACIIIAIGLLLHFTRKLLRFVRSEVNTA